MWENTNGLNLNNSRQTANVYNAQNQISGGAACGQAGAYYDCAGNLLMLPNVPGTQSYDAENRIAAVTGSGTTNYVYDGEGRRVKKVAGSATTVYVYDAAGQLASEYSTSAPVCHR